MECPEEKSGAEPTFGGVCDCYALGLVKSAQLLQKLSYIFPRLLQLRPARIERMALG